MLHQWLETGTDEQILHARIRLAQPDVLSNNRQPATDNPAPIPLAESLEYPPLFQQARNAVQAVGSVVASIVRGEPVTVSQEEQDRRLAICHTCEFWDAAQGRCSKCGCFGAWKTWLASQQCPIAKW